GVANTADIPETRISSLLQYSPEERHRVRVRGTLTLVDPNGCLPRRLHGGAPGPGDSARGPSPWRRSGSRRPAGSRPVFRDPEERRGPEAGTGCAAQPAGRFSGGRSHRRVRCPTGAHGGHGGGPSLDPGRPGAGGAGRRLVVQRTPAVSPP